MISSALRIALLFLITASPLVAQSIGDYHEFYRLLRINAREQVVLCYPTDSAEAEPHVYGVRRDSLGRPVEITRFFFGNIDTRSNWSILEITWPQNDSTKIVAQRRRYLAADRRHVPFGGGWGEDVIARTNGELLYRRLVDEYGEPMKDVPQITMSMYRDSSTTIFQEWRFGNGKQFRGVGIGADHPFSSFALLPEDAYFRRYTVDTNGNLLREEGLSLERRRLPFPQGELIRQYELNDCGQPVRIIYLDGDERPMANGQGVASEVLRYDDHGRVVEWRAYDLHGQPHGRSRDGAAAIRLSYRNFDGVLLSEERFDAAGNPIIGETEE